LRKAIKSAELLLYYGHGDWRKLTAEVDLLDEYNIRLAAGRSISAVACRSARELGLEAVVRFGATGYLGFSQDVLFMDPDPGDVFLKAFKSSAESVLDGESLEQSAAALRRGFDGILDYCPRLGGSKPSPYRRRLQHGAARDKLDGCQHIDAARTPYSRSICIWFGLRSIVGML
jgi:hypothetical protein